ncbi:HD domain-containing protein [Candidatus Gottesmanbacteria bacterium]|nr:HD domain-containing protein [Candidatus Gottesmanbacteria bacterium]
MKNLKNITNLVYEAAVVKRMQRTGWQILGDNQEGVGEHTFMTAIIAYFLAKEVSGTRPGPALPAGRLEAGVNMETILTMAIFHDFHEARTGDLDKIASFYMTRDQGKANKDIFQGVDDGLLATLEEYEKKESLEARIVYEANIVAFLVELKLLEEKGNTHAREWISGNIARLRLPEAVALAQELARIDSHDWWKSLRAALHEEFSK